jgi:predicted oxidoreductase
MKTYTIPQTDLVVSRIAYGCGHLSQPRLMGFKEHMNAEEMGEAIAQSRDAVKEAFVRWRNGPIDKQEIDLADRVIHTAFDQGITLYDHADIYGFGKCEQVFGAVLKNAPGMRNKIVIQTKCGIRFAEDVIDPQRGDPHRMDLSRDHIVQSAERSLKHLGSGHIDILLLHRPDPLVEPEEVAKAFDELHQSGKVRFFGVSNHTAAQIELLKRHIRQPLVVNQLHVSLAYSKLIADGVEANRDGMMRITQGYAGVAGTLDYCRLQGMQIQAWSPLKNALNVVNLVNPSADATAEVKAAAKALEQLAEAKNATPSAIALAWLLRHPARIVPLIGTMNPQRVVDNCVADNLELSRAEWFELFALAAGVPSLQLLEVVAPKKEPR